jgi:predicted AAA+ superfamily ATPase
MIVQRDIYLQQLIDGMDNKLIKIITGLRRSGKTFLLFELFVNYLTNNGIDNDHIVKISFEDRRFKEFTDPDKLIAYIDSKIVDKKNYYIILDEVQALNDFVSVLNSLLYLNNVDIYITGSNSKFLSNDIATEFRGRGDVIHVYPLSFAEYYSVVGGEKQLAWKNYYTFGGLPQLLTLKSEQKKISFLQSLQTSVYIKDLVERNRIIATEEFSELLCVIASSIGSSVNPTKLSNTIKSIKNINLSPKTISTYLEHICYAFLAERALRFDVKGKKYISTLSKYYFQDIGIRNSLLNFRQLEETHIMENIIYNELKSRGFLVDVGIVEHREENIRKQLEIDFVANKGDLRYYIQSAYTIGNVDKKEQEIASFKRVRDSFKRIIIVKDDIKPYYDENGYYIIGLFDFLLKKDLI